MKHIIVLLLIISWISYYQFYSYQKQVSFNKLYNLKKSELLLDNNKVKINTSLNQEISIIPKANADKKIIKLNKNIDLEVQFYSQSPFWKWWVIFNDTCEEASALIAVNYIKGIEMTREEFRDELLKMVDWENDIFWDYKHTDVDQTAKMLSDYLSFSNYEILENPTIKDIKTNLKDENIIIAPFYWIWLNPHYTWKWPEYHFMVIKWYTQHSFIAHDVWSNYWENYQYSQQILLERLHDYDSVSVKNWKKRLIVLKK